MTQKPLNVCYHYEEEKCHWSHTVGDENVHLVDGVVRERILLAAARDEKTVLAVDNEGAWSVAEDGDRR